MLSSARISDIDGLDLFNPGIWSGAIWDILELRLCNATVGGAVDDVTRDTRGPFWNPGIGGNGMPGIMIPGGRKGLGDNRDWGLEVGVGNPVKGLPVKGCRRSPKGSP